MAILFAAARSGQKRQFIIDTLQQRHIYTSQTGKPLEQCDSEELAYEWLLSEFREIEISNESSKFF